MWREKSKICPFTVGRYAPAIAVKKWMVLLWMVVCGCVVSRTARAAGGSIGDPLSLNVKGAPEAYYYKPHGKGMKPVIMYLHGRGGNPLEDCRKWARVASQFGWVVCPSGPEEINGGRTWNNGADGGQRIMNATLTALQAKYKGRVQRRGNILVGFSEGAFVAMQVGLKDQATWSRWLILAASDQYWAGDTKSQLSKKLRKVYLITGEGDGVAENTLKVGETLKKGHVPVKVKIVPGMGHEVPRDRMVAMYRRPLQWLAAGK